MHIRLHIVYNGQVEESWQTLIAYKAGIIYWLVLYRKHLPIPALWYQYLLFDGKNLNWCLMDKEGHCTVLFQTF